MTADDRDLGQVDDHGHAELREGVLHAIDDGNQGLHPLISRRRHVVVKNNSLSLKCFTYFKVKVEEEVEVDEVEVDDDDDVEDEREPRCRFVVVALPSSSSFD